MSNFQVMFHDRVIKYTFLQNREVLARKNFGHCEASNQNQRTD